MNILYITYDGLTDFIGQSQILPYLLGCAAAGHRLTVISFEKRDRRELIGKQVAMQCREANIAWLPQSFRRRPPYVAKLVDQLVMNRAAASASNQIQFDLVHCRSYQAGVVGLSVKHRHGMPLLFDMRGFLPDSRRDGGRWKDDSLVGRALYRRWKGHEARLIAGSDHIIALTQAAKREMQSWGSYAGTPISVIPCCTDFRHFTIAADAERTSARERLNIPLDAPVLGYLGSRETIYMIGEHLKLFAAVRKRDPSAKTLFLGNPDPSDIFAAAAKQAMEITDNDFRIVEAERREVPFWLGPMDAATCFYTPTYSSLHVSPTKLAEYLACGIPVIANRAVGDVEEIVDRLDAGHVVPDFSDGSVEAAAHAFFALRTIDRSALRDRAKEFDLPNAVQAYVAIYSAPDKAVVAVTK